VAKILQHNYPPIVVKMQGIVQPFVHDFDVKALA